MFLDILLGSKATWRILVLMAESPGAGITRPEIRRHTMLGNNAISESLKDMTSHRILLARREGKKTYYRLDMANPLVLEITRLCDIERKSLNNLPYSYSLILREYVRSILSISSPEKILLFGSVAKRTFREGSDIDVALIFDREPGAQERLDIEDIAHRLKMRFSKSIQQHIFGKKEFDKSETALIGEIKKDGIDLL